MSLIAFIRKYSSEKKCIAELARLRWPDGFSCTKCQHDRAHHLECRPRIYECASCGYQHSVTAGTVFHKTKIDLTKWFIAAYLLASDKRGVSAMYVSKELGIRYATAWFMLHRLRASLFEREGFELRHFVEADEAFYGGYREKGARGRSKNPKKSQLLVAIEKRWTGKRWVAGNARCEVIESADTDTITGFFQRHVKPDTSVLSDGHRAYPALSQAGYRHTGVVASGEAAGEHLPLVHITFSNIKAWLNGTHHGVSKKHLHRYLREWNYRFNRRHGPVADFVLSRMATRPGTTYRALVG